MRSITRFALSILFGGVSPFLSSGMELKGSPKTAPEEVDSWYVLGVPSFPTWKELGATNQAKRNGDWQAARDLLSAILEDESVTGMRKVVLLNNIAVAHAKMHCRSDFEGAIKKIDEILLTMSEAEKNAGNILKKVNQTRTLLDTNITT